MTAVTMSQNEDGTKKGIIKRWAHPTELAWEFKGRMESMRPEAMYTAVVSLLNCIHSSIKILSGIPWATTVLWYSKRMCLGDGSIFVIGV
jgi:hypothetical protein